MINVPKSCRHTVLLKKPFICETRRQRPLSILHRSKLFSTFLQISVQLMHDLWAAIPSVLRGRKHGGHFKCGSNLRAELTVFGEGILLKKQLFPLSSRQMLIYLTLCDNGIHISTCSYLHVLDLSAAEMVPVQWPPLERGFIINPTETSVQDLTFMGCCLKS